MNISSKAIDHPRVVLVATLLVLCLALLAALETPVQRTPAISKAVILVVIPYPDAQPVETENEITRKVEKVLGNLKNVDFTASTSMRGTSVTQIIFLDGVDPDLARAEVQDLVDRIRNELPAGREIQPQVIDIDFENAPLMLVTLSGPEDFDQRALKEIAEDVQDILETVPGVANTQLFGGLERELHVNVDPDLATQYGLTIADLRRAIMDCHAEVPGGALNTGSFDASIRNETKFRNVDDIRAAVVKQDEGRLLRIQDVAAVVDTHRRIKNLSQLNGQPCATIIVNKEADINTLGAARSVKARIVDLQRQFPHITFSTTRDASEEISRMFRVLGSSAVFGALLVLVILAWSMGLRISILVLMAIPLSTAVALVFLFFAGIPVSNMVIFSFILVLGMVVDGAIIVAENIHRHIEMGVDPTTAAKRGIDEVSVPVISADLTTIAAYLPMLLVPGIMGDFLSVMPKVVSVALTGSILVDHFLIPTIAARWYRARRAPVELPGDAGKDSGSRIRENSAEPVNGPNSHEFGYSQNSVSSAQKNHSRPGPGPATRAYLRLLRWSLRRRIFVLMWCGLAVVGAGLLYKHVGFVFFPESDRGQFEVRYELPLGYSIEETIAAAKVITEPLEEMARSGEVVQFVSAIGSSEGLASRLENDPATGPEFGTVMVQLQSPLERQRHEELIIAELRERMQPWPGMKITIDQMEEGPPGGYDVAVRLTGKDLEQLGSLSEMIVARLGSVPGTLDAASDYRPDQPELVVEAKADVVGLFGLSEAQLAVAVQTAIAGDQRIQITMGDEDVTLRLQLAPQFQRHPDDLRRLMITSPTGKKATIGQLADITRSSGLYSVNRYDRSRSVTPRCDVAAPVRPDDVFAVLREEVLPELGFTPLSPQPPPGAAAMFAALRDGIYRHLGKEPPKDLAVRFVGQTGSLAEGVQAKFTGENEERDKNFAYLLNSMVIGVILIFAILVLQFNSFRQTVVVLTTVPLSFIGVVVGMWICGFPFSLASFIGLVSLTGVVVNDAIVMVDFVNQARRRGLTVNESIQQAGVYRLRPVILTTVTTIGGLLPLFLNISGGAEFWQPLTGAIIFGLGFATVLTLVVIPVCYSLAYGRSAR